MTRALGSERVTAALHLTAACGKSCEGAQFPAPAAQAWRIVAFALSKGFESLEPVKVWSILIGSSVGLLLTILPRWFPRQAKWMPSVSGIGLSWTFHWYYGLLFFLGALIGWTMERRRPAAAEIYEDTGTFRPRRDGRAAEERAAGE